jgi:predicted DNA-binding transcriptional regulator AlpA
MARRVEVTDLVGAAEIAERLGLSHRETVHSWRRRYAEFPEPVAHLRQALVWSWRDVEAWARRTDRLAEIGRATRPKRRQKK